MADGVTLSAGTADGAVVLTDETATGHAQVVKIGYGANADATVVGADANGLDVDVTREPATAADAAVGLPSVVKVVGGYDGSNVQAISTDASGVVQVDVLTHPEVALDAASLAALESITIVDGGATISVDDGGGSLTVDVGSSALPTGAATSAKQDTAQTALDAIKTAVEILDNAVSGSEMQVDVVAALPAGNNNIGDVDVASIAAGTNTIGNVGLVPRTTGGLSIFRSLDLDETEEEVKSSAGQVYGYIFTNRDTTNMLYLKFYNATAANVTVGTTTPVITMGLPAGSSGHVPFPEGIAFGTAITVAATTGVADNDTGAPDANDVVVNIFYA
jgi:hypothetical protein